MVSKFNLKSNNFQRLEKEAKQLPKFQKARLPKTTEDLPVKTLVAPPGKQKPFNQLSLAAGLPRGFLGCGSSSSSTFTGGLPGFLLLLAGQDLLAFLSSACPSSLPTSVLITLLLQGGPPI